MKYLLPYMTNSGNMGEWRPSVDRLHVILSLLLIPPGDITVTL